MEQIVQLLIDGDLQISHRISKDQSSWKAICNEDSVELAIREIIESTANSTLEQAEILKEASLTQTDVPEITGGFDLQKVSQGISVQLKDANELSTSNHTLTMLRQLLTNIAINKKAVINIERPVVQAQHVEDADVYLAPPPLNKLEKWHTYKKLIGALSLCICLAGGYYAYIQFLQYRALEQQRREKDLADKALKEKILTFFDRFLQIPAAERNLSDPKSLLLASQAMLKQNDVALAQVVTAQVLTQTTDKSLRAQAYTLNGMAQMSKKDWTAACKEFDSALLEDANLPDAHYNLGISYLNRELYEESEKALLKAIEMGTNRIIAGFALYEAVIKIESKLVDSNFEKLNFVDQLLKEFSLKSNDLKAEILIARTNIAKIKKDQVAAEMLGHEFIGINPATIQKEKYRTTPEYQRITWNNIYTWCTDSYSRSKNDGIADAMLGGCLLQIQKNADAITFSKLGNQRLPNDKLVRAILGYALQTNNLNEETKSLFRNEDEKTLPRLALIALAHVCEKEKTSDCALKYWGMLTQMDKTDPSAFVGLMNFYIDKDDLISAKKTAEEAISRQPASEDLDRVAKRLKAKGLSLW